MMQRRPREHDEKHLAFVRQLPCVVCGDDTTTEAAHIRMRDRRIGKVESGIGAKPDDCFVVPLCGRHHREQHGMNERQFWKKHVRDPIVIGLRLHSLSGDHAAACRVLDVLAHDEL